MPDGVFAGWSLFIHCRVKPSPKHSGSQQRFVMISHSSGGWWAQLGNFCLLGSRMWLQSDGGRGRRHLEASLLTLAALRLEYLWAFWASFLPAASTPVQLGLLHSMVVSGWSDCPHGSRFSPERVLQETQAKVAQLFLIWLSVSCRIRAASVCWLWVNHEQSPDSVRCLPEVLHRGRCGSLGGHLCRLPTAITKSLRSLPN